MAEAPHTYEKGVEELGEEITLPVCQDHLYGVRQSQLHEAPQTSERLHRPPDYVEELGDEITCPICQDHFCEPKILPCQHYYCKDCIRQLALRQHPFPCPECRSNTVLPQNDPDKLPTAFFVNRIKELHTRMERAEEAVPIYYPQQPAQEQQNVVQPQEATTQVQHYSRGSHWMTIAIILTCVATFCCTCCAVICTIPAIVFASNAQSAAHRGDEELARRNKKCSISCTIAGIVTMVVLVLGYIIAIIVIYT